MLAPVIDDAHLIDIHDLRRLRLLFEDFPKNHNIILVAQPGLLTSLALSPNHDLQNRVTYSVLVPRLAPDDIANFIRAQLDAVTLPHATFTADTLALIVRASDGFLRRARNLCLGSLIEAVRDRTRCVDLKQVNRVLLQPHWREKEVTRSHEAAASPRPNPPPHSTQAMPSPPSIFSSVPSMLSGAPTAIAWPTLPILRAAARRCRNAEYVDDGDPNAPTDADF